MNVVIRPVNDRFLTAVAFPAFEQGAVDATGGLAALRAVVADERMTFLLDSLLETGVQGGFFTLDAERWLEAVYRLLFCEWGEGQDGLWQVHAEPLGYAGTFDQTLQLALLLEDPTYPYATKGEGEQFRDDYLASLPRRGSLAGLVCGAWEPMPAFAPDQILSTQGRGFYRPAEGLAVAEWSYRSAADVRRLQDQLPDQLRALLDRERKRLAPLPLPEGKALLAHWINAGPRPPLAVAFSGLGVHAAEWAREIGLLVALIRAAADRGQGLSCVMTGLGRQMADALEAY